MIAVLPVCVTEDVEGATARAAQIFAMYGSLPSYRAMLDREGAEGAGNVMVCGDEDAVRAQLGRIGDAGATEFAAAMFGRSSEEFDRTRALLRDVHATA